MTYRATVVRVMVASPSDVQQERLAAQAIIHNWNVVNSHSRSQVLLPILWETHTTPALGERAQSIINKQIVVDSDMLVAMFWTRIGTPTGDSQSGTIEEIEEHVRAGKPVLLYFSNQPVRPDSIDDRQYRALLDFKESAKQRGLIEEYESLDQFREKLSRHLAQTIISRFPMSDPHQEVTSNASTPTILSLPPTTPRSVADSGPSISPEAQRLLTEATKDGNGVVLVTETFGGLSIETNQQEFNVKGDPRSEARARRTLRELLDSGLIEQRDSNGEVFAVTDQGYRVADITSGSSGDKKRELISMLHQLRITSTSFPHDQTKAEQIRKVVLWPASDATHLRSLSAAFGMRAASLGAEAHSYLNTIHHLVQNVQNTPPTLGFDWRKFDWEHWRKTLQALERTLLSLATEVEPEWRSMV